MHALRTAHTLRPRWNISRYLAVSLGVGCALSLGMSAAPNPATSSPIPAWRPEPTNEVTRMIRTLSPAESQSWRLMLAFERANADEARAAMEAYPALARSSDALGQALERGLSELAEFMLDAGADPAGLDATGASPLHYARDPALVERLLESGAVVDRRNHQGLTPLHALVESGCPSYRRPYARAGISRGAEAKARLLLDHGADILAGYEPARGETVASSPLGTAIVRGCQDWAELLLAEARISLEARPGLSQALLLAAARAQPRTVRALLRHQPSLVLTNDEGLTPIQLASLHRTETHDPTASIPNPIDRANTAALLLDAGAPPDVFSAAGLGRVHALEALLSANPQAVNSRDARRRTPLHWAVLANQESAALRLLDRGMRPDLADDRGRLPLHLAAEQGLTNLVGRLIQFTSPLNVADDQGRTPLHGAACLTDATAARLLLEAGANPDVTDRQGRTALELATRNNRADVVKLLLARRAVYSKGEDPGTNPLHTSVETGNRQLSASFLRAGIDVNTPDDRGRPPLHLAIEGRDLPLIELLLKHGADLEGRDALGNTAVHLCLPTWRDQVQPPSPRRWRAELLAKVGLDRWIQVAPPTPPPPLSLTEFLLDRGLDPKTTNNLGETALHRLAWEPNRQGAARTLPTPKEEATAAVVGLLLERGAAVDARDAFQWTPLHRVTRRLLVSEAELLLDHGADIRARDAQVRTVLHLVLEPKPGSSYSALRSTPDMLRVLLARGAEVDAQDRQGYTPLHHVVDQVPYRHDHLELLLDAGANPHMASAHGQTPLHLGLVRSDRGFLKQGVPALIEAGADVAAVDALSRTPLHFFVVRTNAPYQDFSSAPRLMTPNTVNAPDTDGNTPLHLAAEAMRFGLIRSLVGHGADRLRKNRDGKTPVELMRAPIAILVGPGAKQDFYPAVAQGDVETVEAFLKVGPSLVNRTNQWGRTPLQHAAYREQPEVAQLLVQHGAVPDPVAATFLGRIDWLRAALPPGTEISPTPGFPEPLIHSATRRGHLECLALLLERGASTDTSDDAGHSAWFVAKDQQRGDIVVLLERHGAEPTVFDLVHLGDLTGLSSRLQRVPAEATLTNGYGDMPLHTAARLGRCAEAQLLLRAGAPINAPGTNGLTALHLAIRQRHPGLADQLLRQGASPGQFDRLGLAPLHYAAVLRDVDSAKALIDAGADVNAQLDELPAGSPYELYPHNRQRYPAPAPLHHAVMAGQIEMVRLLLRHGARPERATATGYTPVHLTSNCLLKPAFAADVLLDRPHFIQITPRMSGSDPHRLLDPELGEMLREMLESSHR